ncbi:hypothetical protein DFR38_101174 [Aquitalea magnusonii]|uniref:Uncharacterized protein n=1 Tax=Aquitalea magnusonii TaxID=332411 RepID=A0A318JQQ4_9NEIS|nr:hypothetical protein DFR38_101174 [Aquitalea magnusonii]
MLMLRSMGQKVDVIDDMVFVDKAKSLLKLGQFTRLRMYLENQHNREDISTALFCRTATLEVQVESGKLPASHTASYKT